MKKIPVGILGATGMVGQQYLQLLIDHPWFEVVFLAASEASVGKKYSQAVANKACLTKKLPENFSSMPVNHLNDLEKAKACRLVFSALTSEVAKQYEESYAQNEIGVLSNASYHRMSSDVPILIPEINPDHAKVIELQRKKRTWQKGFLVVKPNCSLQSYMIPLAPLHEVYKVKRLLVTTMQAVSGAGYPGISCLDIIDNVIPHIPDEEEKSEKEPLKIWGSVTDKGIISEEGIQISTHCNRVPVLDGHTACVSVEFEKKPKEEEILKLWQEWAPLQLPSSPAKTIIYREENNRPQPKHDRDSGAGMSITCGRLRKCSIFDFRFVALSHNTIRGAAGGGILNAEFLKEQGFL